METSSEHGGNYVVRSNSEEHLFPGLIQKTDEEVRVILREKLASNWFSGRVSAASEAQIELCLTWLMRWFQGWKEGVRAQRMANLFATALDCLPSSPPSRVDPFWTTGPEMSEEAKRALINRMNRASDEVD